ncbi:hypothetical protein [Pseudomonas sp. NFX224]|uniref:hypothetical protein n=1 Tax=Pseudomonas sp. NFX224 TaxID=3402862 RepID=UPI003AFB2FDA
MDNQNNAATLRASSSRVEALDLESVLNAEAVALSTNPGSAFYTDGIESTDAQTLRKNTKTIGLALSGGGIRSATFCLGILQALAKRGKLASFDYLSTVSGGGYIGSWLTAWIHRDGLTKVQECLGKTGTDSHGGAPTSAEPAEIVWLRRYSNYLAPRVGLLSMDALTLIATWLRNVTLNLIVLLGLFAFLFTLPYALLQAFTFALHFPHVFGVAAAWGGLFFIFGIGANLWYQGLPVNKRHNWPTSTTGVVSTVILPGLTSSIFAVVWWARAGQDIRTAEVALVYLGVLLLLLLFVWFSVEIFRRKGSFAVVREAFVLFIAGIVALFAGGIVLAAASVMLPIPLLSGKPWPTEHLVLLLSLGVPIFLASLGVTTTIYTGMVGRTFFERSREWWSRLNAWLILIAFGWAAWFSLTFFSLPIFEWLLKNLTTWFSLLGTGWVGSLLASVFLRRPESASAKKISRIERWLNLAASVFVTGLMFVIAAVTQKALFATADASNHTLVPPPAPASDTSVWSLFQANVHHIDLLTSSGVHALGLPVLCAATITLLLVTLLFACRVDINKFSLHNMYKNRLIRCYLGASNQKKRNEQPFVGLDEGDDFSLHYLGNGEKGSNSPPQLPFHIINATLNITQGSNLAWQERKAASFTFTPLYCGYSLARTQGDSTLLNKRAPTQPAYRPTEEYAAKDQEEKGFTLGMALATSGAAVSPNMGRASLPMLAFILTMFNIRLGRWSPNPARDNWCSPSPKIGLIALLQELLGLSDERSRYVYLSDGGHFDNLGIYELIRRRCSVILAVDASADSKREMTDLADAVRKCRIDLGVDISFPQLGEFRGDNDALCEKGFVRGIIRYDAQTQGTLILIKPSLSSTKTEPADILNYAIENPTFPHQTTADQFFDESQFESFRQLGKFIGDQCLNESDIAQLLPSRTQAEFSLAPPKENKVHGWLTRTLGALLNTPKLPDRKNSLVDWFLVIATVTIALGFLFIVFDTTAYNTSTEWCWTWSQCQSFATQRITDVEGRNFWGSLETLRLVFDNFFVLMYTATFLCGLVVALNKRWLLWLLLLAPVITALSDYGENFILLSVLYIGTADPQKAELAELLGIFTTVKFFGFLFCLSLQLLISPWIYRAFAYRWNLKLTQPGGKTDDKLPGPAQL